MAAILSSSNKQLTFLSLNRVHISKKQEAKQKLLDIQILCTDVEALKKNE